MELLIRLLIAHMLGDFVFQNQKMVQRKESGGARSGALYLHVGIHAILALVFSWTFNGHWWVAGIILASHYSIDLLKLSLKKSISPQKAFFADQGAHILVIVLLSITWGGWTPVLPKDPRIWITLASGIFLLHPSSVIIRILISPYTPKTEIEEGESLRFAGTYIGMLERLLVFVFIASNHWEGVGFLIAAKSVFRFSDLTQAKDRKLTEYVLIGTLLSFGLAITAGLIWQWAIISG